MITVNDDDKVDFLHRTVLRKEDSLKSQLFKAFGVTSVIFLATTLAICLSTISSAGQTTKDEARSALEHQASTSLGHSSRYVAESVTKKFSNLAGMTGLIEQVVLDRFQVS